MRKHEITVSTKDGPQQVPVADSDRLFAVHPRPLPNGEVNCRVWHVSHRPTGRYIAAFSDRQQAIAFRRWLSKQTQRAPRKWAQADPAVYHGAGFKKWRERIAAKHAQLEDGA